jgi:hypothetical protein
MQLDQKIKDSCFEFAEHPWAHTVKWKDAKSYSQSDKERVPTVWSTEIGGCEILVMCSHRDWPNTWIMVCHKLHISQTELYHKHEKGNTKCETAKDAAFLAVKYCKEKVNKLNAAFNLYERFPGER